MRAAEAADVERPRHEPFEDELVSRHARYRFSDILVA